MLYYCFFIPCLIINIIRAVFNSYTKITRPHCNILTWRTFCAPWTNNKYCLIFRTGARFKLAIVLFSGLLMFLHSLDWYVGLRKRKKAIPNYALVGFIDLPTLSLTRAFNWTPHQTSSSTLSTRTRHLLFPCCTLAKLPFYVKVLSSRLEFLHLYVGVYTILTTSVYGGLPTEIILM